MSKTAWTGMRCYCCDSKLKHPYVAYTEDGFEQFVGPECRKQIEAAGHIGWDNPRGGPVMFAERPQ